MRMSRRTMTTLFFGLFAALFLFGSLLLASLQPREAGAAAEAPPPPDEAGATPATDSSLASSRLTVLPGSPRGRTVAVQSPSETSGPAVPPEIPAAWLLPVPAVLRSATGARPPPPQAAIISVPVSMKSSERLKRSLWRRLSPATPSATGPEWLNRVAPVRRRRANRRN